MAREIVKEKKIEKKENQSVGLGLLLGLGLGVTALPKDIGLRTKP